MLLFTGATRNSCACKLITKTTNSRRFFCKIIQAHRHNSWILRNAYLTAYYQSVPYAVWMLLANLVLFEIMSQDSRITISQWRRGSKYLDLLSRQYLIDLNLNIFVRSHTIQVNNQDGNVQERVESPLLLPTFSLLNLIIGRKKILEQVSLRAPITTRYVKW